MRRTTFGDFDDLFERMNRRFEEMSRRFESNLEGSGLPAGDIALDLTDHGDAFVVTADLPGFEKRGIDLTLSDDLLTIAATRDTEAERTGRQYIRRERGHASIRRTLRLPESVREGGVGATYRNGILTVTLPKANPDEPTHRIDIE